MDQRTPPRELKRARAPIVDQPEPGFFKLRLHTGGWHEIPCRILYDGGLWSAEIDGEVAGLPHADPIHADGVLRIWHKKKTEITEAEYAFLTTRLKAWAREFYPDHPLLHPDEKVNTNKLRPIPQFTAPTAPAPLDPEPLPENRPQAPKPMSTAEIKEWLEFENEALVKAIDLDVTVLTADHGREEIAEEAQLARLAANVDIARGHYRQATKTKRAQKDPFLQGGRDVDAWFARHTDRLEKAVAPVQRLMNEYGERKDRERRAEAQRIADAARAEAQARAQAAADALARERATQQQTAATTVLLDEAADAAEQADKATTLAAGKSADLTRSFDSYGSTVSGKEVWGFEVADIAVVPLAYLQVNETMIRKAILEYARDHAEEARAGVSPITGIRITRSIDMRSR